MPDQHEPWLGMAALSALDVLPADEAEQFAAHLRSCTRCSAEVDELRQVAGAMNEVDMTEHVAEPSPDLEERVVGAVRDARGRQQWRRRLVSSVGAAAAAIALIGVGLVIPQPAGPPQEALTVATSQADIDADVALVAHTWGTEVKLVVTGLEAGEDYRVTLLDRQGERFDAGTFIGVSDRPIVCDMNAALLRPDASRLEVAGDDGLVIAADLPAK